MRRTVGRAARADDRSGLIDFTRLDACRLRPALGGRCDLAHHATPYRRSDLAAGCSGQDARALVETVPDYADVFGCEADEPHVRRILRGTCLSARGAPETAATHTRTRAAIRDVLENVVRDERDGRREHGLRAGLLRPHGATVTIDDAFDQAHVRSLPERRERCVRLCKLYRRDLARAEHDCRIRCDAAETHLLGKPDDA